jgi:hypothetical protein
MKKRRKGFPWTNFTIFVLTGGSTLLFVFALVYITEFEQFIPWFISYPVALIILIIGGNAFFKVNELNEIEDELGDDNIYTLKREFKDAELRIEQLKYECKEMKKKIKKAKKQADYWKNEYNKLRDLNESE